MNFSLSPRLAKCCELIPHGSRVADICCDHGYLGIFLLANGIASSVIASDINRQPLESARRNAEKYGMADRMALYLSDGCKSIPHDFDTLVCAGIGADIMISILDVSPWLKTGDYTLILQCQSKVPTLRRYLSDEGWRILDEVPVRDGRFVYTVMLVRFAPGRPLSPGECFLSTQLLAHAGPELEEYKARVLNHLQLAVQGSKQADPFLTAARQELISMEAKL